MLTIDAGRDAALALRALRPRRPDAAHRRTAGRADAPARQPSRSRVHRDADATRRSARSRRPMLRIRSRWRLCELLERLGERADAPRLSRLRAGRALRVARRRSPPAGDRHQDVPAARRGHGLQAALRISHRRSDPAHRLEGHAAARQADRPRVPGRARPVRAAADRLRAAHARRRPARRHRHARISIRC